MRSYHSFKNLNCWAKKMQKFSDVSFPTSMNFGFIESLSCIMVCHKDEILR